MSGITGTWGELIYKNAAVGVQGAVNTAEAQLNTNATMGPQPIIPGGFFTSRPQAVGQAIRVVARGVLSTTTGPPTLGRFSLRDRRKGDSPANRPRSFTFVSRPTTNTGVLRPILAGRRRSL